MCAFVWKFCLFECECSSLSSGQGVCKMCMRACAVDR